MHKILKCSSEGDIRFSSLYATLEIDGIKDTIDHHLQTVKRFYNHQPFNYLSYRYKQPDYFVFKKRNIPYNYYDQFNILLWYNYFKQNEELFEIAKTYKQIEDPIKEYLPITSVSTILSLLIENGFQYVYSMTKDFRTLIKNSSDFLYSNKPILNSVEDVIFQEVNCQGITNNTVFNEITMMKPVIKEKYNLLCKSTEPKNLLGDCQFLQLEDKIICNAFIQFYYTRRTKKIDYVALRECLLKIKDFCINQHKSLIIPYDIGCNNNMIEFEKISKILLDIFNDFPLVLHKKIER